jgi:hypothetical protein
MDKPTKNCKHCGHPGLIETAHHFICRKCGVSDPKATYEQFDLFGGTQEAEAGMELAESGKSAIMWAYDADEWFETLSVNHEFTGDDVRRAVGVVGTGANKNNAVGAWFSKMSKARRIEWTGRFHKSVVVSRHANQHRIWRKIA